MRDCKYSIEIIEDQLTNKFICPEVKYAFKASIEALEKQIPKNVTLEISDGGLSIGCVSFGEGVKVYRCACGELVGYHDAYCRRCGQKLEWNIEGE